MEKHPASFKDPSGFIFQKDGIYYRHVASQYTADFEQLMSSGLYEKLVKSGQLIAHEVIHENIAGEASFYITLKPEQLEHISYPYEWSFDQLKDAALLTLNIVDTALQYGMILKDATPYNIQFRKGKPLFIDTLSFEKYNSAEPWVAYRQFCETFLNPLLLEHYGKTYATEWLRLYFTGISSTITAGLLPRKAYWSLRVWLHVLLQQKVAQHKQTTQKAVSFSQQKMQHLLQHLRATVKDLKPSYPKVTNWNNYYSTTILGKAYLNEKEALVVSFLENLRGKSILDLGANDGHFAKLLAPKASRVIAAEMDASCINRLYREVQQEGIQNIYPIVQHLTNPSPTMGFNQQERAGFLQRNQSDIVLALALIHHLSIGENIPFERSVDFFAALGAILIIEFVPKSDDKVKEMLTTRKDIFDNYHEDAFEQAFQRKYSIERKELVHGTTRMLYLMKRL